RKASSSPSGWLPGCRTPTRASLLDDCASTVDDTATTATNIGMMSVMIVTLTRIHLQDPSPRGQDLTAASTLPHGRRARRLPHAGISRGRRPSAAFRRYLAARFPSAMPRKSVQALARSERTHLHEGVTEGGAIAEVTQAIAGEAVHARSAAHPRAERRRDGPGSQPVGQMRAIADAAPVVPYPHGLAVGDSADLRIVRMQFEQRLRLRTEEHRERSV